MNFFRLFFIAVFTLLSLSAQASIQILAAENIYGSIAANIGGNAVEITNILNNPNQDPHLFSLDPRSAKAFQNAQIIIINGDDYDPWAENFTKETRAQIINVADINHVIAGSNPHLWYNLDYMASFARRLNSKLKSLDPAHQQLFDKNLAQFLAQLTALQNHVAQLKSKLAGQPVTATEPVAQYLTDDLGLTMLNKGFQLSVMNDTEPSIKDHATMRNSLITHGVKLLIINKQVYDPVNQQLQQLAETNHIPVIGVTELLPLGQNYLTWMQENINQISTALE